MCFLRVTNILYFWSSLCALNTPCNLRRLQDEFRLSPRRFRTFKRKPSFIKFFPQDVVVLGELAWFRCFSLRQCHTYRLTICALRSRFYSICHTTMDKSFSPTLWVLLRFTPVNTRFKSLFLFKFSAVKRALTMGFLRAVDNRSV